MQAQVLKVRTNVTPIESIARSVLWTATHYAAMLWFQE